LIKHAMKVCDRGASRPDPEKKRVWKEGRGGDRREFKEQGAIRELFF